MYHMLYRKKQLYATKIHRIKQFLPLAFFRSRLTYPLFGCYETVLTKHIFQLTSGTLFAHVLYMDGIVENT